MLEIEENKQTEPEHDPSIEDDDLDWLDLGAIATKPERKLIPLSISPKEVQL